MAGGQDHPPLLADEQEQKHDQASDEGQADPDDGPGVVAGTCGGKPGWGGPATRPWPQAQRSGSLPGARPHPPLPHPPLYKFPLQYPAFQPGATTSRDCVTWAESLDFSEP